MPGGSQAVGVVRMWRGFLEAGGDPEVVDLEMAAPGTGINGDRGP